MNPQERDILNQNIKNRGEADAKKAVATLPQSTRLAITHIVPNILNGAFWGFGKLSDFQPHFAELSKDKNLKLRKVNGDDCIIESAPDSLVQAVASVDSGILGPNEIQTMKKSISTANISFEKFLARKASEEANYTCTLGIYCINETTSINYKGVPYPAFRVPVDVFLGLCNKWRYQVKINGKFVSVQEVQTNPSAFWNSIILSPTKTGVFIDIRSTLTVDQAKQMKKQLSAQAK